MPVELPPPVDEDAHVDDDSPPVELDDDEDEDGHTQVLLDSPPVELLEEDGQVELLLSPPVELLDEDEEDGQVELLEEEDDEGQVEDEDSPPVELEDEQVDEDDAPPVELDDEDGQIQVLLDSPPVELDEDEEGQVLLDSPPVELLDEEEDGQVELLLSPPVEEEDGQVDDAPPVELLDEEDDEDDDDVPHGQNSFNLTLAMATALIASANAVTSALMISRPFSAAISVASCSLGCSIAHVAARKAASADGQSVTHGAVSFDGQLRPMSVAYSVNSRIS